MTTRKQNSPEGPNLKKTLEKLRVLDSENVKLLNVVRDLLKAHTEQDSKYWPALAIFLERLEKGLTVKRVTSDFHNAYRQANPDSEIPSYWYTIVNEIRRVALMGRVWIEEHRAKKSGFWSLLELAKFELSEPKKKSRGKDTSVIKNKHFRYFLEDCPAEFPFLFACFTEEERLPNLEQDPLKDFEVYERMCIRLLERLLSNPTFFFNPEHNWPNLCRRIIQQIQPTQVPPILDIELIPGEDPQLDSMSKRVDTERSSPPLP